MDYYDLLGVSRTASDKELHKAFKKKSMQHHPDRGGDAEKFKEINEAYSTLKDPNKRQMYDQFGTADPQQAGFQQQGFGGDFQDIFNNFFGGGNGNGQFDDIIFGPGGFQQRRRATNNNIRTGLQISLEQAYFGHDITFQVPLPTGGTRTVDCKVPKGIDHGQTVRLRGLGDQSVKGAPPGDLLVVIQINDWQGFKRNGNDLQRDLTVDVFDLILGTKVMVKHINGHSYSLNVPAGTQPNTTYSMAGLGMPDVNGQGQGNLYVKIQASIPKNLTPDQIKMITKLRG